MPTFVVDAYTFRILSRHALVPESYTYEELRHLFMDHLPPDVGLYQEYHALLVRLGRNIAGPSPGANPVFCRTGLSCEFPGAGPRAPEPGRWPGCSRPVNIWNRCCI